MVARGGGGVNQTSSWGVIAKRTAPERPDRRKTLFDSALHGAPAIGTFRRPDIRRYTVASTKNAAEFLRMTDVGTLEAGKSAGFIALDTNPLDDITNTRRISAVYLLGTAVDRTKAP